MVDVYEGEETFRSLGGPVCRERERLLYSFHKIWRCLKISEAELRSCLVTVA